MTCDELKKLAQNGQLEAKLAEPGVRAHLAECAECEALFGNASLARIFVAGSSEASWGAKGLGVDLGEVDAFTSRLKANLLKEVNSPWNVLRDLRTSVRRALVLGVVGLALLACLLLSARADLAAYPLPRLVVELVFLWAIIGVAVWESTRSLAEPWSHGKRTIIVALCIATPIALALVSSLSPVAKTHGTSNLHSIGACLLWGTATALPAALVLWLSKRQNPWEEARVPLVAATLGVVGNLLLQVHCPSSEFVHLVSAHAPLLVVFALGFVLWGRVRGKHAIG